jgi:hypothetical protein
MWIEAIDGQLLNADQLAVINKIQTMGTDPRTPPTFDVAAAHGNLVNYFARGVSLEEAADILARIGKAIGAITMDELPTLEPKKAAK